MKAMKSMLILLALMAVTFGFAIAQETKPAAVTPAPTVAPVENKAPKAYTKLSAEFTAVLPGEPINIDVEFGNSGTAPIEDFGYVDTNEAIKKQIVTLTVMAGPEALTLKTSTFMADAKELKKMTIFPNQFVSFKKINLRDHFDFTKVVSDFTVRATVNGTPAEPLNMHIANASARFLMTDGSSFVIELLPGNAPNTCKNFVALAKNEQFYDEIKNKNSKSNLCYRAIAGQVLAFGSPFGDGTGGPGYSIAAEVNQTYQHKRGSVGMCRLSDDPNSAGSMFYITLSPQPQLDKKYTVFAEVIRGLDVLDKMAQTETTTASDLVQFKPKKDIAISAVTVTLREKHGEEAGKAPQKIEANKELEKKIDAEKAPKVDLKAPELPKSGK